MNKRSTLLVLLSVLSFTNLKSQIEQVSIGPAYSQQAYYKISTGEITQVSNEAWDIAFSNLGGQDAGIMVNESASFMGSPIKAYAANTEDWSEVISDVSVFTDEVLLHNPELSWSEGAFNTLKEPMSPFDFGWGAYNPMTHTVEGTNVYVIQKRDGSFIKFQVINLASGEYTFRYAGLDGNNEQTYVISKADHAGSPMMYFSFNTGESVEMPTDYDLIFQRYTTPLDDGYGGILEYTVTGVLLAPNTEAVVADSVDPVNVSPGDYYNQYSDSLTIIGHDWKSFDFQIGWIIDEDRVQFVKTSEGEIYKIIFFDFEGSSSGVTTLEKTLMTTTSIESLEKELLEAVIYPNPTADFVKVKGIAEASQIKIYNQNGQLLSIETINPDQSVDVSQLTTGQYIINIISNTKQAIQPLVILR